MRKNFRGRFIADEYHVMCSMRMRGRLTYFGSNKPGKLVGAEVCGLRLEPSLTPCAHTQAKIGQELEKHAQTEARRAGTHPKARA